MINNRLYNDLTKAVKNYQKVALVTVTMHPDSKQLGRKWLMNESGLLEDEKDVSPEMKKTIVSKLLPYFRRDISKTVQIEFAEGVVECYMEMFPVPPRLIVAGAGHVSEPVAEIGKMAGFHVTVIDDRAEFANRDRFPTADEVICTSYLQFFRTIPLGPETFIVLLTRGHQFDVVSLQELLRREQELSEGKRTAYIGMIGSRRRISGVFEQLKEEFSDHHFSNIYSPVGLDIGGHTPAEIAVSIIAEMLKVKNGKSGVSLKEQMPSYSKLKFRERVSK
ncbi:XdhC family protein [Siminovitchia sediminis]|uniref:XdhC family protein n=1 Tax=Siminovitchia sediminis TaxID=1274353 RepID=A0ABW4KE66_9BACI